MKVFIVALGLILITHLVMGQDSTSIAPVNVTVTDFKKLPRKGDIIIFINEKTQEGIQGVTNNAGKFKVGLPGPATYEIKIKGIGRTTDYNKVEIPPLPKNAYYTPMDLMIMFEESSRTFTLDNVHFETGKSTLTKASYDELKELFEYMTYKDELKIEIAGHTDHVGDDQYNLKLSQERADTVRSYLMNKGISGGRIIAKGYGETKPIADNNTEEGRRLNRRTEVYILE